MKRTLICGMALTILMAMLLTSCHKETNNNSNTENPSDDHYANQQYPPTAQVIRKAVTDIDGNIYDAVQIGNQVWMAENLRTTRFADGTEIQKGTLSCSYFDPCCYAPDNNSSNVVKYGYLYNGFATMNIDTNSIFDPIPDEIQGICPDGWHVPNIAEWQQLIDYMSTQPSYIAGGNPEHIAKALASTQGWGYSEEPDAVGNNPGANNATGFSALPVNSSIGDTYNFGYSTSFWSATPYNYTFFLSYVISKHRAMLERGYASVFNAYPVRCVRD